MLNFRDRAQALDAQPKATSHHHSPASLYSAPSLRKPQDVPQLGGGGAREQRQWDRHNTEMRSKLGRGSLDITRSFRRPFSTRKHIRGDALPVLICQPGYALPGHTARTNGRGRDPCIKGPPLLNQRVSFPSWRYVING